MKNCINDNYIEFYKVKRNLKSGHVQQRLIFINNEIEFLNNIFYELN